MRTPGTELSVELFAPANWTPHTVTPVTADYPGMRPTGSWMLQPDGELRGIAIPAQPAGVTARVGQRSTCPIGTWCWPTAPTPTRTNC